MPFLYRSGLAFVGWLIAVTAVAPAHAGFVRAALPRNSVCGGGTPKPGNGHCCMTASWLIAPRLVHNGNCCQGTPCKWEFLAWLNGANCPATWTFTPRVGGQNQPPLPFDPPGNFIWLHGAIDVPCGSSYGWTITEWQPGPPPTSCTVMNLDFSCLPCPGGGK